MFGLWFPEPCFSRQQRPSRPWESMVCLLVGGVSFFVSGSMDLGSRRHLTWSCRCACSPTSTPSSQILKSLEPCRPGASPLSLPDESPPLQRRALCSLGCDDLGGRIAVSTTCWFQAFRGAKAAGLRLIGISAWVGFGARVDVTLCYHFASCAPQKDVSQGPPKFQAGGTG